MWETICGLCAPCLGKYPMFAFTHGKEISCREFQAQGDQYCKACWQVERTISHRVGESCELACRRRIYAILSEITDTAGKLGDRLYELDVREQSDQFETLARVRQRLEQLRDQPFLQDCKAANSAGERDQALMRDCKAANSAGE